MRDDWGPRERRQMLWSMAVTFLVIGVVAVILAIA
jgi:hypothetical protein